MSACIIRGLRKGFCLNGKELNVLKGIDLRLEAGSFVSLVGYSGCGKSTFLRILLGLTTLDGGSVRFEGMEGRRAIVFQEPRLIRSKTVGQNLLLALHHCPVREEKERVVESVLCILGLSAFRNAYPHQLSGGMAQRIALGRALCRQPELLLMDEPFGALDALTRKKLQQELVHIYLQRGITVVFVTHDVGEAVALGKRVLVMEDGRIGKELPVRLPYPRNKNSHDFIS